MKRRPVLLASVNALAAFAGIATWHYRNGPYAAFWGVLMTAGLVLDTWLFLEWRRARGSAAHVPDVRRDFVDSRGPQLVSVGGRGRGLDAPRRRGGAGLPPVNHARGWRKDRVS